MKGSNIRGAVLGDAEKLRDVYVASIRGLCSHHYTEVQIAHWTNRPANAFEQDIQNTIVCVCEFQNSLIGYGQIDLQAAAIPAVYVHPDFVRRGVGSLLFCFLECEASSADIPRLNAKVPLNAVPFFCAHDYAEIGPTAIALPDGTSLAGVDMAHQLFQKIEFADDQSFTDRVLTCLQCDDGISRMHALHLLKEQSPREVLDIIVSLLNDPEQAIRRRAGGSLTMYSMLHEEPVNVELKADELAHYLEHGEDPVVRMSCALGLGRVYSPTVDRAFFRALEDTDAKVVQWSCCEVVERGGAEGTAAAMRLLDHPSWQVRLTACIRLIRQRTADHRVVATLEALCQTPEAVEHDAWEDDFGDLKKDLFLACGEDHSDMDDFGKMASILAKAREVANHPES